MSAPQKILVTGGAGFIGSALVRHLLRDTAHAVVNVDCLTYASNLANLAPVLPSPRYVFERADICDTAAMARIFVEHRPDAVIHLAAESHVDRSIDDPQAFVRTNVLGTQVLLDAALARWRNGAPHFRFVHVSTDEVYGSLGATGFFTEETPYAPRSPYSASKAAADHLALAYVHTYGLPVLVGNCSNNYGPYQFPEKLIPLMILNAAAGKPLPIYGQGKNVRDWLHVDDHVAALMAILERGRPGEKYNIGGNAEHTNIDVVRAICTAVDGHAKPLPGRTARTSLMRFVADRPGHDARYAIDAAKIARELNWHPRHNFADGLAETVRWYLDNEAWWRPLQERVYGGERLGLKPASVAGA